MADNRLVVDYSRLMLSMGDVPQVQLQEMEWSADNVLTVKYDRGLGSAYDHVYLYIYVPELGRGFLSAGTYRREKRIALALPDEFAGHDAHVYLMVQADDGRWSHSLYAGEIAMDEVVGGEEVTSGPVETAHSAPTAQNVSDTNISPSHNNSDKSAFSEKIKKSPS
jgi:hypothetical protein